MLKLKQELRDWEISFASTNGKRPDHYDIDKQPEIGKFLLKISPPSNSINWALFNTS